MCPMSKQLTSFRIFKLNFKYTEISVSQHLIRRLGKNLTFLLIKTAPEMYGEWCRQGYMWNTRMNHWMSEFLKALAVHI